MINSLAFGCKIADFKCFIREEQIPATEDDEWID